MNKASKLVHISKSFRAKSDEMPESTYQVQFRFYAILTDIGLFLKSTNFTNPIRSYQC